MQISKMQPECITEKDPDGLKKDFRNLPNQHILMNQQHNRDNENVPPSLLSAVNNIDNTDSLKHIDDVLKSSITFGPISHSFEEWRFKPILK